MSAEQNAQIVRESLDAALDGNWDLLQSLYAEDAVMEGTPQAVHGNEAIVQLWQGCHKEVPGLRGEVMNVIAQDDIVAIEWQVGPDMQGTEVHMCQLKNGKITSVRVYGMSGSTL